MDSPAKKSRLGLLIDRFRRNGSGSVAMSTGIMFTMLFVAAGGAFDYTNTITKAEKVQDAMDATVLSLAKRMVDPADLQAEGQAMFAGLLQARGLGTPVSSVQFAKDGDAVRGSANFTSNNSFLSLIGLDTFDSHIGAAAIPPEERRIEISLVLDVSGSMSEDLNGQQRIAVMKSAVNGMFDTLDEKLPQSADVYVALVPYSSSVNIGNLGVALEGASAKNGVAPPAPGSDIWAAERSIAVNGTNYSVDDASPGIRAMPFVTAAEMYWAQPLNQITPLTASRSALRSKISALTPAGTTAGHIGLAWGVYSLSEKWGSVWPEKPAKNGDADKIIVILSDGKFNTVHNIGGGSGNAETLSYAYYDDMCDYAKGQGITIYAVALNLNAADANKLGKCAGNGGQLFNADTATELKGAFEQIAVSLGRLRLSS